RKDKREEIRKVAEWAYEMRSPEQQRDCEQPDDEQEMPEAAFEEPLEITVQLSDIINAVEMTYDDIECFLDKKTGAIISSDDIMFDEELADRVEEHGFFFLPRTFGIHRAMVKFVKTLPEEFHSELKSALKGKDIVGRFEAAVL
ncbi:MAG: hypothetical protein IJ587_03850, partial [Synergistaceae bacterium]|nr:hypothetical protein [Synergistaceae bacterium]